MVVLGVLLLLLANAAPASADADRYTEYFDTTIYEDAAMTNVTGWGSGAIRLPREGLATMGRCDMPADGYGVAIADNIAYVADTWSGLQLVNITDPDQPSLLGGCDTPGRATAVTVAGGIAYVTDDALGLQLIDVTNPLQPLIAGACQVPIVSDVAVSGRIAWVAALNSGLLAIDVTNPDQPVLLGIYTTGNPVRAVAVFDGIAYVTVFGEGLTLINTTNPFQPVLLSSCNTPGSGERVVVEAGIAYIADGSSGLQLIDVSNPLEPSRVGSYDTVGDAIAVAVVDRFVYVVDNNLGLVIIDATTPSRPLLLGGYDTPAMPMGVAVAQGIACITDGSSCLIVLKPESDLGEDFKPVAVAQSLRVFDSGTGFIARATLSCFPSLPTGTAIVFAFSVDDGAHWETVTPYDEHMFTYVGSRLRWRAVLTSSNPLLTPVMTSLAITVTVAEYVTIDTTVPISTTSFTVSPWWEGLPLSPISLVVTSCAVAIIVIVSCMIVRESRSQEIVGSLSS